MYPQRIQTVHVEQLDRELCIYDWQRMQVHNLNPTAAQVWELCDGQTSPAQMAAQLQADLDTPHAEELVWLTLQRLKTAHLLQSKVVKPAGRKVYTRREMLVKLGVAAALLPVINSIVAPGPVEAQSPQSAGPFAYIANSGSNLANLGSNNVSVIDTVNNSVVATIPVGTGPADVAVSGTRAYVANNGSDNVSVIDTGSNSVVDSIPVGRRPFGVAVSGTRAYVTNHGSDNVSVIDTGSNSVVATILVGDGPFGVAVS